MQWLEKVQGVPPRRQSNNPQFLAETHVTVGRRQDVNISFQCQTCNPWALSLAHVSSPLFPLLNARGESHWGGVWIYVMNWLLMDSCAFGSGVNQHVASSTLFSNIPIFFVHMTYDINSKVTHGTVILFFFFTCSSTMLFSDVCALICFCCLHAHMQVKSWDMPQWKCLTWCFVKPRMLKLLHTLKLTVALQSDISLCSESHFSCWKCYLWKQELSELLPFGFLTGCQYPKQ